MLTVTQTYVERERIPLAGVESYREAFVGLLNGLHADYRHRHRDIRFRVPKRLKWPLIHEFEDEYYDTMFGDLSDTFVEMTARNWGLLFAGVPVVLDPSLHAHIAIDTLDPPTKHIRSKRAVPSLTQALKELTP